MPVSPIPDGYRTVTPYLIVKGAGKLIEFMTKAFDAKVVEKHATPDGMIMHAAVQVGDSKIMMGDAGGDWTAMPACIHMYFPDTDGTYRKAMAAGATSVREPADQFYGDRNAIVRDEFGNLWSIATHQEDVSREDMERRMAEAMKK